MPEGHSVHRITRQFAHNFVGRRVEASSPQGRFAEGAMTLNGRTMTDAQAVGKQMFLEFGEDLWLRVHLGIYGAWDFAGVIDVDPTILSAGGRMGQTNQRGTELGDTDANQAFPAGIDLNGIEDSVLSIGAPRRARVRMGEETTRNSSDPDGLTGIESAAELALEDFPPEPVGQVRLRLLTENAVADLRGPTVCELMVPEEMAVVLARLGPDPMSFDGDSPEAERAVVDKIRGSKKAIGLLLMDQSVIAGIGNVYRAEMLFRARLNPHTPGMKLNAYEIKALWQDWRVLLAEGIRTGQMVTIDGLQGDDFALALADREHRHWVYRRAGLPCRVCGTPIVLEEMAARNLFYCPSCQG
ncbi:MAG: DNA-formamidopyrimidine glycosylase family protein [Microbacteriaceae bacterium]